MSNSNETLGILDCDVVIENEERYKDEILPIVLKKKKEKEKKKKEKRLYPKEHGMENSYLRLKMTILKKKYLKELQTLTMKSYLLNWQYVI
jgi:hypothetical protein